MEKVEPASILSSCCPQVVRAPLEAICSAAGDKWAAGEEQERAGSRVGWVHPPQQELILAFGISVKPSLMSLFNPYFSKSGQRKWEVGGAASLSYTQLTGAAGDNAGNTRGLELAGVPQTTEHSPSRWQAASLSKGSVWHIQSQWHLESRACAAITVHSRREAISVRTVPKSSDCLKRKLVYHCKSLGYSLHKMRRCTSVLCSRWNKAQNSGCKGNLVFAERRKKWQFIKKYGLCQEKVILDFMISSSWELLHSPMPVYYITTDCNNTFCSL